MSSENIVSNTAKTTLNGDTTPNTFILLTSILKVMYMYLLLVLCVCMYVCMYVCMFIFIVYW